MPPFAAQRHHQTAVLRVAADHGAVCGAADGEKLPRIGQFHELRHDDSGRGKGTMNVPHRTGPALFGQRKGGRVEPLGDIARPVDPQEKERHPLRAVALQRGQPVADLFEDTPKAAAIRSMS